MNGKRCLIVPLIVMGALTGCNQPANSNQSLSESSDTIQVETVEIVIDFDHIFQKIESFGASGAWWSQDVGGWVDEESADLSKRAYIAELLFDPDNGIGLSSYRYNLGAGSTLQNSPKIEDPWRRAESFEDSPGIYNWENDQNAQWMLNQAVEYGIKDIYLFVNSPLTRLTKNGSAYGSMVGGETSNLSAANYEAFATYVYDVAEYFIQKGIPVTHLSPINEPQWEWIGGQEGNHYSPDELIALLQVFVEQKNNRPDLKGTHLSMPELGEWSNSSLDYFEVLNKSDFILTEFNTWDIHSYWSNPIAKSDFKEWLTEQEIEVDLKMTEWTEMVNGRDETMNSALTLANEIYDDLTILDVIVWQYWIAVSQYDYRDGLIYVDLDTKEITPTKRLWGMGNFSKFVKPGYRRVLVTSDDKEVKTVSFVGENEEGKKESVTILINNSFFDKEMELEDWQLDELAVYVTDSDHDLEKVVNDGESLIIPRQAIVTLTGIISE